VSIEYVAISVSLIGVAVPTIALFVTINQFKKQLQLSVFSDYTKRYQEIILNFPACIGRRDFDFSALDSITRDNVLRYMRAYFDLCSEEYYLWEDKCIADKVWREWESGIKYAFSTTAFIQGWKLIGFGADYYARFACYVNSIIDLE